MADARPQAAGRDLHPWWVQVTFDPTGLFPDTHELYVLAEDANQATYALTNYLRAERGLAPFQDGLGDFNCRSRRLPPEFATVIERVADPLPPNPEESQ